jgi:DNA-binding response OmpR family regulator
MLDARSVAGPVEHDDTAATRGRVARGHLLLVEDDPDIGATVCEYVREEGYPVMWADDGSGALEHLRDGHRPGLIVTDFVLPRVSGADLVRELGHHGELRDIPVLVVSAVPHIAAAAGVPVNVLVTKPLDLHELMVLVTRHCRRRPAPRVASY